MKQMILLAALALSLVSVSAARAHDGNRWFTTAAAVTGNIEAKYKLDVFRKCFATGDAHAYDDNGFGKASYDHFYCLVDSLVSGRACWVKAHITGEKWFNLVLTTTTGGGGQYGGCTPRDIRTRPGYRYS